MPQRNIPLQAESETTYLLFQLHLAPTDALQIHRNLLLLPLPPLPTRHLKARLIAAPRERSEHRESEVPAGSLDLLGYFEQLPDLEGDVARVDRGGGARAVVAVAAWGEGGGGGWILPCGEGELRGVGEVPERSGPSVLLIGGSWRGRR
jgi:hypothetical protein